MNFSGQEPSLAMNVFVQDLEEFTLILVEASKHY